MKTRINNHMHKVQGSEYNILKVGISLSTYNIDIINKFKGEIYMSHKCGNRNNCGCRNNNNNNNSRFGNNLGNGICGISPCCLLIAAAIFFSGRRC